MRAEDGSWALSTTVGNFDIMSEQPRSLATVTIIEMLKSTLARKREIDARVLQTNNMESTHRWMVNAVELLLKIELERQRKS
jgi:hypothetical protein